MRDRKIACGAKTTSSQHRNEHQAQKRTTQLGDPRLQREYLKPISTGIGSSVKKNSHVLVRNQDMAPGYALTQRSVLQLQRQCGNRYVQGVMDSTRQEGVIKKYIKKSPISIGLLNTRGGKKPSSSVSGAQLTPLTRSRSDNRIFRSPGPYEDKFMEFQNFIRLRMEQIDRLPLGTERTTHEAILQRLIEWVQANQARREFLTANPLEIYERLSHEVITAEVSGQIGREQRAPQDEDARQRKINEYWNLAYQLWGHRSRSIRSIRIPSQNRAVIIQTSTAFQMVLSDLASQLMDWAYSHYFRADFTASDPVVILSEIADRPRNRLALALAHTEPVETESVPIPEERREFWQTSLEMLIGFIPIIGDISDIAQAFAGMDIWGGRLGTGDRALMMLGAMIPLVPGRALRGTRDAGDLASDLAQQTGRHADELLPIIRAAESFRRQDITRIENAVQAIRQGRQLNAREVQQVEEILARVGRDLRRPLPGAIRRGATRTFVEFTEEAIEHVGVRHVPEMFDPQAALRSLNQQGITDPNHVTHLFPPGIASSDRRLTTLMRQAIRSREAATSTGRVFDVSLRGSTIRVVTGAGAQGQGVRIVSMFPTQGVGISRRQIERWAHAVEQGQMSIADVRRTIADMF